MCQVTEKSYNIQNDNTWCTLILRRRKEFVEEKKLENEVDEVKIQETKQPATLVI